MANNLEEKSTPAGKQKSLKEIQLPNWLAILLIAAVAAICILIFWLTRSKPAAVPAQQGTVFTDQPSSEASPVEVLPQPIRIYGEGGVINPFATESLGSLKITGIISNSNGKSTAIIETLNASYILGIGDTVPGSSWQVSQIAGNYVTFSNNSSEKTFYMEGQN